MRSLRTLTAACSSLLSSWLRTPIWKLRWNCGCTIPLTKPRAIPSARPTCLYFPEILTKIYSVHSVMCSIFRMLIGAVGSYLLTIMVIEKAMVVVGILCTIITLILSRYMKKRIGLKPEEYTKKDLVCMK